MGYGQREVSLAIEKAKNTKGVDYVIADFVAGNQAMYFILKKLGFKIIGKETDDNEIIMRFDL